MRFSDLECCPFCGCEEYYEKGYICGSIVTRFMFDGSESDNSEMYEGLDHTRTGRVYCSDCHKYLGNMDDDVVGVAAAKKVGR